MTSITIVRRDAIAAGLILLACSLKDETVSRADNNIGAILTSGGDHHGLSVAELHDLAQSILTSGVSL